MQSELQVQMKHLQQVIEYHQLLYKEISYIGDLDQLLNRNKQGAQLIQSKIGELIQSIESKV